MSEQRRLPSIGPSARVRFGGSFALAFALHTSAAAALMAAGVSPGAKEELLVEVELAIQPPERELPSESEAARAPQPQPAATPPKPTASVPSSRPRAKRPEQRPPEEVAAGEPAPAAQPLVAPGSQGGWVDDTRAAGSGGGTAERDTSAAVVAAPAVAPAPKAAPPALAGPVPLPGNVAPHYSLAARLGRVQGTVVVSFDVLEDGRVANPRIVSGPQDLHETVLKAVASWRFKPGRRGDTPIRVRKTQSILFRLEAG